jgi:hypothetical protein
MWGDKVGRLEGREARRIVRGRDQIWREIRKKERKKEYLFIFFTPQ